MSRWRVPTFPDDVWIALKHEVPRGDRARIYAPGDASWRVEDWFQTGSSRWVLLAICHYLEASPIDAARTPTDDLRARVRVALRRGELVAYRVPEILGGAARAEAVVQENRAAPREELTWIEVAFVWADDGSPVSGLKIEITPPGQSPIAKQTDGSGKVRLDSIKPGTCRVTSSFEGVKAAECVTFVEMGEPPEPPKDEPKPRKRKDDRPPPKALALLRPHRVRAADTLASLARSVGLTWQQLARFNWGVDDPDGVDKHLRDDVGCWDKTADGANYVFSDFDDPGVVVLPRPWSATALATTDTHYVQVRRLPPAPRFIAWSQ